MATMVRFRIGQWGWVRYGLSTTLGLIAIAGIYLGGLPLAGAIMIVIGVGFVLDDLIGDDRELANPASPTFCNINLYLAAPLLLLLGIVHMIAVARVESWRGPILLEITAATGLAGYLYALLGATVGHELVHRTQSAAASILATIVLAFTFNTSFTVFHLAGHHRYVATLRDPASARRGENWLGFLIRTIWGQTVMAWAVEMARLRRRHLPWLSWQNRVLRGQAYSLVIMGAAYGLAGLRGVLAFVAAALIGRIAHELINYIQHYGLVRLDDQPVEERHTWDCKRLVSNALQYNLPRHADHHLHADRQFWNLTSSPTAPTLPYGYQTMAMLALVPALWRRSMRPLLLEWDEKRASSSERKVIAERGWNGLC
jgi:putative Mn2+ efflux pump MntP